MDGSNEERRLIRWVDQLGYQPMRAPASGAATDRELPDVLFGKEEGEFFWVGELKTDANGYGYVTVREVEELKTFAKAFNAEPRLILRPGGDRVFYFIHPDECDRTDSGKYSLKEPDSYEDWPGEVLQKPKDGGFL